MRVLTFIFLLSFLSSQVKGQDSSLFVIASCSEGVMLDGKAVSPGQMVDANSKQLTIPKNGYSGVITNKGYAQMLTKSIPVDRIVKKVNRIDRPRLKVTGAAMISVPEVYLLGAPQNQFAEIAGDSIFIAIKANYNQTKPPYKIEFKNMFEEVLLSDSTVTNWKIREVKSLFNISKEGVLLFEVRGKGFRSVEHLIRPISDRRRKILNLELSRIIESGCSEILKLAIFQLYNLFYDHMFLLYQLAKINYKPENEILKAYLTKLKEQYQFQQFNFHK